MILLRELLNEIFGDRATHDEQIWRQQIIQQTTGENQDHWIITPQGKKYGPFPSRSQALTFLEKRVDIPRNSRLHAVRKGGRI